MSENNLEAMLQAFIKEQEKVNLSILGELKKIQVELRCLNDNLQKPCLDPLDGR